MMSFPHWIGHLLWLIFKGSALVAIVVSTAVVLGLAAIYAAVPILASLSKERSPFKKAKGQSKGPINPYASEGFEPKP